MKIGELFFLGHHDKVYHVDVKVSYCKGDLRLNWPCSFSDISDLVGNLVFAVFQERKMRRDEELFDV